MTQLNARPDMSHARKHAAELAQQFAHASDPVLVSDQPGSRHVFWPFYLSCVIFSVGMWSTGMAFVYEDPVALDCAAGVSLGSFCFIVREFVFGP